METGSLTLPRPLARSRRLALALDIPAICAWSVSFTLIVYLSLRGGGYDAVVRSEVGIVVWWTVLIAALAGLLPRRCGRAGWAAIGLLTGFALWTGLASGWSESAEQTVLELGRVAAYLGVLVLAIVLQGRAAARHTIGGLTCAIALVTVMAVLSRLHPQAFPADAHLHFLSSESARKLSYPLGYWNALAAFAAMGAPLLLGAAVSARSRFLRAGAAAMLPISALCLYFTISRGGVVELGLGIAVFLLLVPRRIEAVATLLVSGAGAAILLNATSQRPALTAGLHAPVAYHQGTEIIILALMVCAGVGLLQMAIALADRNLWRPPVLAPSRRTTGRRAAIVAGAVLILALAAGAPSKLERAWHDFKQPQGVVTPGGTATLFTRLSAANGNSRYQFWQAALHANATHPWRGIGPGTFQFWWARHATADGFIRNAHSLYFETLAETGIIGFALLGGLLLLFAVVVVRRAVIAPEGARPWLAATAGALTAFLVAAGIEWVWQLPAIAAAALVLGAVIVAGRDDAPAEVEASGPGTRRARTLGGLAVVAAAVIAIAGIGANLVPLAGALAVRESQDAAARGDLLVAAEDSLTAQSLQPYASTPRLQSALVYEAAGDLGDAARAARAATARSPTDWTTWLTLARIDARRGATTDALVAMRRARSLNPRSTVFAPQ